MQPVAYRVSEFCQVYVISKASFYREVQAGRLRLLKRGRRSLVERTEAERWFTCLRNHAAQEKKCPKDTPEIQAKSPAQAQEEQLRLSV